MKNLTVLCAVFSVFTTMILAGCTPAAGSAQAGAPLEPIAVPIEVAPVERGDIAAVLSYAGTLQPVQTIDVMNASGEKVVELYVNIGDRVQQGDVLLVFDTATLKIQQAQARAALSMAQAELAKMKRGTRPEQIEAAQATLNLAHASLSGTDTASQAQIEAAAGSVAQAEAALKLAQAEYDKVSWAGQVGELPQALALEQATVAYQSAMANYDAVVKGAPIERTALQASLLQAESALALAKEPFVAEDFAVAEAGVEQAKTALDLVQTQMDRAVVESPIDGWVTDRYVSLGETPLPGSALFTLVSDQVEVVLAVEEGRIGDVYRGQPASIRVVAYPDRDFPASVTSVSPTADAKTHTFTLRVSPAGDQASLKGGMFADVSLLQEEHAGTLLIPLQAVIDQNGSTSVYVARDGQVESRTVTLGLEQGESVEVLDGLAAGELVVVAGQAGLSDGSAVKIDEGNNQS